MLYWYTAAEAFPRVAIGEGGTICFDEDHLLAIIHASWIWIGWRPNKFSIDNDVLPVRREVARLKLLLLQIACNAACSTRIDIECA
jgi:hypothetical protein